MMRCFRTTLFCTIAGVTLTAAALSPAGAASAVTHSGGYTVSRTVKGVRVTVHFARRVFPAKALIEVTDTIRNLSHPSLALAGGQYPYGLCSWPAVSIDSVDSQGNIVQPQPPIERPVPPCPAPLPKALPVGHAYSERQFIVLWTPRLRITPRLDVILNHCACAFVFPAFTAHFTLTPARPAIITVQSTASSVRAVVTPPRGGHGPLYYQTWGSCARTEYYWVRSGTPVIHGNCGALQGGNWHVDAAWLNTSVVTLNLGAG